MILQIFITLILLATLAIVLLHRSSRVIFKLAILVVVSFGIYLAWVPDDANRIAGFVGVGRGADLVTYIWILLTIFIFVLIYIKFVEQNRLLTKLVRRIALLDVHDQNRHQDEAD